MQAPCMQVTTTSDWVFIMYDTMDGFSTYTWPIFLVAVMLGAFFIVNLMLAVLYLQFTMDQGLGLNNGECDLSLSI